MTVLLNVVFALSESIPKFDGSVTGAGNDLPVISTEADREDIRGVADKSTGGETGVQVPETEGVIPGRREGELAIRRNDHV